MACELNMTRLKCLPERLPRRRCQVLSAFQSPRSFYLLLPQYFVSRGIRFSWAVGILNDRWTGSLTSQKFRSRRQGPFRGEASVLSVTQGTGAVPGAVRNP